MNSNKVFSPKKPRPPPFLLASSRVVNLIAAQKIAVRAARAAGRVMRDNWYAPKKINLAEAHDIKLELDVRCQALIEKTLAAAFPKIPVLGEEGNTGDTSAEFRWVIDPIDGTVNYAFGLPHAGVSIALQSNSHEGRPARRRTQPSNPARVACERRRRDLRPLRR